MPLPRVYPLPGMPLLFVLFGFKAKSKHHFSVALPDPLGREDSTCSGLR